VVRLIDFSGDTQSVQGMHLQSVTLVPCTATLLWGLVAAVVFVAVFAATWNSAMKLVAVFTQPCVVAARVSFCFAPLLSVALH
jgi:hypothetical protein